MMEGSEDISKIPVEDPVHDQLPSVDEIRAQNPNAGRSSSSCPKSRLVVLVAVLLLLILTISSLAVAVKRRNSSNSDAYPSRFDAMITYLVDDLKIADEYTVRADGTPQNYAAYWIADIDPLRLPFTMLLAQRYAMAVFYFSLGGPYWRYHLRFLSDRHECDWYLLGTEGQRFGVNCDRDRRVSEIFIPGNNLQGSLPTELQLFPKLEYFQLSMQPLLRGSIPQVMQQLTELTTLSLHYCGLGSKIPDWLHKLTNLETLFLSNNQFAGSVPASMSTMTSLTALALDDNALSGNINELFGPLRNLEKLYLEDNAFDGELTEALLEGWPNMTDLDLSFNQHLNTTLPSNVFELDNLEVIDLHKTGLSGGLPSMGRNDSNLEYIALHLNDLDGPIPAELSNLHRLQYLDLSSNQFSGDLPESLIGLSHLVYLHVADNELLDPGEIPLFLKNLTSLTEVSLKNTNRNGTLPEWLGELTNLEMLDLARNQLEGTIPPSIGNLDKMEHLLLNRNMLNGTVPLSIANLTLLNVLLLDGNDLTGTIENSTCKSLDELDVFIADCDGDGADPEISCPCCTTCCHDSNSSCNDFVWLGNNDPIWEYGFKRRKYHYADDLSFGT